MNAGKRTVRAKARALGIGRSRDTTEYRPDGWREVQPRLPRQLPPAAPFRPIRPDMRAPVDGVYPLPDVPHACGWWVVKTTDSPLLLRYYSDAELTEARHLHQETISFYPFAPLRNPDSKSIEEMRAWVGQRIAIAEQEETL